MLKHQVILFATILTAGISFGDQTVDIGLRPGEKVADCYGESDSRGNYAMVVRIESEKTLGAGSHYYLYTNSVRHGPFDFISRPELSPDGKSIAYCIKRGNKDYVCFSEKEFGPFQSALYASYQPVTGEPLYVYEEKNKWYLNLAGRVYGPFDTIPNYPKFSPDGKAFVFTEYNFIDSQVHIILNGKRWKSYQKVDQIWFPPDSAVPYYAAVLNGKWFYFEGEREIGPFDKIYMKFLFYDGSHPVCQVWDQVGTYIFNGVKKIGPFDEIGDFGLTDDSGSVWYTIKKDGGWLLITPQQVYGPFKKICAVVYSEKAGAYTYAIQDKGEYFYIKDGNRFGPLSEISTLRLSADGISMAYTYKSKDGWSIRLNDQNYGPFKEITYMGFIGETKTLFVGAVPIEGNGGMCLIENGVLYQGGVYLKWKKYFIIKDGSLIIRE